MFQTWIRPANLKIEPNPVVAVLYVGYATRYRQQNSVKAQQMMSAHI
jgi:hypothetical protein